MTRPLDAIQARCDAATKGPWYPDYIDGMVHDLEGRTVAQTAATDPNPNATFIAHARRDVPALIARVQELEQQLAEMTRCRDAAIRALNRDDIDTDIDVEDTVANPLWGPGWDWEDEHTPRRIARDIAPEIRPALAKATQQRDAALARIVELEAENERLATERGIYHAAWHSARNRARTTHERLDTAAHGRDRAIEAVEQLQAAVDQMPRCNAPHPVTDGDLCERQPSHDGWHAASVGAWPDSQLPHAPSAAHDAR
ncbi:hypothetical protein ACIQF6_14890 [Kitasatospora sp. NPDC092948]|uniref:hypothetical protein n=1 Tax=Kitasatospora sp. NPDC092948 TaxID=3364088 RepID=UPI00380B9EFE